jgi:hypothetical protein
MSMPLLWNFFVFSHGNWSHCPQELRFFPVAQGLTTHWAQWSASLLLLHPRHFTCEESGALMDTWYNGHAPQYSPQKAAGNDSFCRPDCPAGSSQPAKPATIAQPKPIFAAVSRNFRRFISLLMVCSFLSIVN